MNDPSDLLPLTETVAPTGQDEVVEVVAGAAADGTPLYPLGGMTCLRYGARPSQPGRGLSLGRLDRVVDYPAALCPLAKRRTDRPDFAERFELFVAGMELANAYTELNDPAEQEKNFLVQLRGQEESITKLDRDYIAALEYGMPPAGGLGIGIDRLVMVLTGASSIRDVVLFPLLRPLSTEGQSRQ